MNPTVQNLEEHFAGIVEHWSPRVIAECNGQYVKAAKLLGEFVWHDHALEDELFLVVRGALDIELEESVVRLEEGELFVVPRGVSHRPVAESECWILLFEPKQTAHTGKTVTPLARSIEEQVGRAETGGTGGRTDGKPDEPPSSE